MTKMEPRLKTDHSDGQQRRGDGRERRWGYGLGSEVEVEVEGVLKVGIKGERAHLCSWLACSCVLYQVTEISYRQICIYYVIH